MLAINKEEFPVTASEIVEFQPMWRSHGIEVAGKPMELNIVEYEKIQDQDRLIWIVARIDGHPIGYSGHVIYYDRHFRHDKIAADDIWYVKPEFRGKNIGFALKKVGLQYCKEAGVTRTYDLIRRTEHSHTMESLGYTQWGTRWTITL